jgi:hypothetical protein
VANEALQIIIGADTKDMSAALRQARKEIDDFEKKVGLVAQTSGKANVALGNLGRVASDLPFGFIAIGNNIEPLIQSFQSLNQSSGGLKGALKAIGTSLAGPTGILLGFSLVSAAVTVAIQKYGSLDKALSALFGTQTAFDKEVIKGAESIKKYNESVRSVAEAQNAANASASAEGAKVQALASIVLDTTKSYNQRNEALRKLKEINKDYFSDIDLEGRKLGVLKERVDQLTESRIQDAIAREYEGDIAKTTKEIGTQTKILKGYKLEAAQAKAQLAAFNAEQEKGGRIIPSASSTTGASVDRQTRTQEALQAALDKANSKVSEQNKLVAGLTATNNDFRTSQKEAILRNLELSTSINAVSDANKANSETAKANAAELKRQTEEAKKQAEERKKQLAEILARGSKVQTLDFTSFFDLDPAAARDKYTKLFAPVTSAFEEALAPSRGQLRRDVQIVPSESVQQAISSLNVVRDNVKLVSDSFTTFLAPAIDSAFNALANGTSVIDAVKNSLRGLLAQLAANAAKALLLKAALSFVPGAGALAGAGGGGGILGALFSGGGLPRLSGAAAPTFGGVSAFGGGLQLAGQVVFTQRGTDLVGVLNSSNARINRVG